MRELLILASIAAMAAAANNYTHCPDTEPWRLPHEYDCTKYYKCYMGKKFMFDCDKDIKGNYLCFDPDEQDCYLWKDCKCRNPHCSSPSDRKKWKDPEDERRYFQCLDGTVVHRQCDDGTVFDPALLECRANDDKCRIPGTRYPHECYCNLYYVCQNGQLTGQKCATGWLFDDVSLKCLPEKDAHCSGRKPGNNGCPAVGKAQIPDPDSCYRYFQCVDGVKTPRPCPQGTVFDEVKLVCVWWAESTCDKKDATTPQPSNTCWKWPKPKKPNLDDCNRYYECVDGEVEEGKCRDNHYFNELIQACDIHKYGDCKRQSSNKDPDCSCVSCGAKRFPHKICEWYFECQNGVKQVKECSSGLHYNKYTEMCDLPENARCVECNSGTRNPHECQCDQYYECNKYGHQVLKTCPIGKNFDAIHLDCLPKEKAICHKRNQRAISH